MTRPEVCLVVVSWNSGDHLSDCLRSVAAHPPSRPWSAVVVDNASRDGSVELAKRAAPWCRFIENRENRGLAAANNQGIIATAAPTLVISNPDVVVSAGAIDALCDLLDRKPRAALAIPQLLQSDGARQVSVGGFPALSDLLPLGPQRRRRRRGGLWWHDWDHGEERRVDHGAEAFYAVRRAAIVDAGPQDERFALDWEGIEWSRRFGRHGWEAWFTPEARVLHAGGASVRQVPYRWVTSSHRGMYRYFAAEDPAPAPAPVLAGAFIARAAVKAAALALNRATYDASHRDARIGP